MKTEVKTTTFLEEEEKQIIEDFYILIQNICDESDLTCCQKQKCPFQNFCYYMAIPNLNEEKEPLDCVIEMFDEIGVNVSKQK